MDTLKAYWFQILAALTLLTIAGLIPRQNDGFLADHRISIMATFLYVAVLILLSSLQIFMKRRFESQFKVEYVMHGEKRRLSDYLYGSYFWNSHESYPLALADMNMNRENCFYTRIFLRVSMDNPDPDRDRLVVECLLRYHEVDGRSGTRLSEEEIPAQIACLKEDLNEAVDRMLKYRATHGHFPTAQY